jgi:hypothetical protein
VLTINSRYTKAEAYTAEGLEDVNLTFSGQAKDAYVLYQNIPNPFNGNTTIGFDMAEVGNASLEIRTIEGKVIESVEGNFNKGYNELTIKDLNTTGLLYYTLRTDDFSATKKMILVK